MCVLRTIQGTERRNAARLWPDASNMAQHGDLSIVLTESKGKIALNIAENQMAVFQLGAREGIKLT